MGDTDALVFASHDFWARLRRRLILLRRFRGHPHTEANVVKIPMERTHRLRLSQMLVTCKHLRLRLQLRDRLRVRNSCCELGKEYKIAMLGLPEWREVGADTRTFISLVVQNRQIVNWEFYCCTSNDIFRHLVGN